MGIGFSDNDSGVRSKLASLAFTAIGLAFFFGVGLAGGAAYKIYFSDDGGPQTADLASPPPPAVSATPPDPILAANAPDIAEKPAPDSAPIEAAGPQAAPEPAAADAAMMAQAAAPPAPEPAAPAAANDPLAAPAASQAAPDAQIPSAPPATQTALQSAEPQEAAAAPPKPATATPARRPASTKAAAPQAASMHPPPAAQGSAAGAFRVQFGAFASEENARHLQSMLEAAGLKVVVSRDQAPSGNQLFYVRSPSYPDRAAAMSAAQNVQNRAQHAANPARIDYAIIADHAARDQHAQR